MQLATALVINVLQLCVHVHVQPMGGEDAALLNLMQTCTLVLTTYINFGALTMNSLTVSQTLASLLDPSSVDEYDAPIAAIGILMQVLTFGLLVSFGGVAIKKGALKASGLELPASVRSRFASASVVIQSGAQKGRQLPASVRRHISGFLSSTAEASAIGGNESPPDRTTDFASANPLRCGAKATKSGSPEPDGIELGSIRSGFARPSSRQLSTDEAKSPSALPVPVQRAAAAVRLPAGWTECTTSDSSPYYNNRATGETTWTAPLPPT